MTEQQVLTSADIANMSMEQYAQVRDRLLAQTSRRGR
jgi:flagellar hook-basal body complex protein FliE